MFKDIEKKWKVEYYFYNLTEKAERYFYTFIGATIYAMYIAKICKFRVWVTDENN